MIILYSSLIILTLLGMGFLFQRPLSKSTMIIFVVFPLLAISLYWSLGHSQLWLDYQRQQTLSKNLPNINQVILEMQVHLSQNPDSSEGWYLLGRLYASQHEFKQATQAFAKANTLHPNQEDVLINYAVSLFMQQDTQNAKKVEQLLLETLKLNPNNDAASNLLAIQYYQEKQYEKSITIWEKLSEKYPADTPEGQALLKAIAKAQNKI